MKIEACKFYRCRDGSKGRAYAIYPDKVHGAVLLGEEWEQWTWDCEGYVHYGQQKNPYDLISEWSDIEPTKEQLAAAYAVFDDLPDPVTSEAMCLAIARAVLNAPKGE